MIAPRYIARSASDHTDDWSFWFVADSLNGGLNVTGQLFEDLSGKSAHGAVLTDRPNAEGIAKRANESQ